MLGNKPLELFKRNFFDVRILEVLEGEVLLYAVRHSSHVLVGKRFQDAYLYYPRDRLDSEADVENWAFEVGPDSSDLDELLEFFEATQKDELANQAQLQGVLCHAGRVCVLGRVGKVGRKLPEEFGRPRAETKAFLHHLEELLATASHRRFRVYSKEIWVALTLLVELCVFWEDLDPF